jgi:hypothetical protein
MTIADAIPDLDDKALASLHDNAVRLMANERDPRHGQAEALLPLIDAELAARAAARPARGAHRRARNKT